MLFATLLPAFAFLAAPSFAQNAYEVQVYGSETQAPGTNFLELHSNTATEGPPAGPGPLQPDRGAYHETLELTHGFTDWFETGFYLFTSARQGEGWAWVGDHVRPRVRVPSSWGWPVGASLSIEAGYLRSRYSDTRWDLEIRPIVDWRNGPFYVSVNPAFEHALSLYKGGDAAAYSFAPNAKLSWDVTRLVTLGLEYYGNFGTLGGFLPSRDRLQQLYPALDLNFSPDWEFNAGVGFGLTDATDRLDLKLVLGRRL